MAGCCLPFEAAQDKINVLLMERYPCVSPDTQVNYLVRKGENTMLKKTFAVAMLLVAAGAVSYAAAPDSVKSGLQVGESTPAYNVNDCTGPSAGKSLCYRCKYGARPVVNIFTRDITPEVASLIAEIDKTVGANQSQKMAAFVVHLTDDTDASAEKLKKVAKDAGLEYTPLTNYEGAAGPASYKIAKEAEVTVMMWVKGEVKVNHVVKFDDLNKQKISQIVGDTKKILN